MNLDLSTFARKTGVYCIRNLFDGKEYVGSAARGFGRRWRNHVRLLKAGRHHNYLLQMAWNAYGEAAFAFEVLEECPPGQCIAKEQERIDAMDPEYNICREAGSQLGYRHTPETIEKMRVAKLGKKLTRQHKINAGLARLGHEVTPATRAKIGIAHLGQIFSSEARSKMSLSAIGNKNSFGHKHTQETKLKISLACNGKNLGNKYALGHRDSDETRMKKSISQKLRRKQEGLLIQYKFS